MTSLIKLLVIAVLLLPLFSNNSHAQSTKQQIEELKQQIEAIQRQNQQQIEQLQQQVELMENERAADSEKMSEMVEKDKEAWYNKFKAKYNKGLTFQSDDGNWKMRFRMRGQFQFSINDTDQDLTATNFKVRRLRFKWDGHAFRPWFLYTVQLGAADSVSLRDMYFTFAYQKEIAPRVGQFKVPFNREELNSSGALQLVERSIVNEEFNIGRDRGIVLLGGLGGNNNFSYEAGVFNGDGRNGKSIDSNMLYAGRIQLGLGGDNFKWGANGTFPTAAAYKITPNFAKKPTFVVGAAVAALPGLDCTRKTPDGDACDRVEELGFPQSDFTSITGDMSFKMPYFNIQGSYVGRWLAPDTGAQGTAYDQGFNVQGGVFVMPETVEIAGRLSYIDYDTGSGVIPLGESVRETRWAVTPGISYYMSHDHRWKIQVDYSYIRNEFTQGASDIDENIFRAQLQAYF
jgi:phosphate-selective porin OprO and OprP